jgi:hypothetical protein
VTLPKPLALRKIMQELGRNMQAITGGFRRRNFYAPKVAAHSHRLLKKCATSALMHQAFDAQTHEAALAMPAEQRRQGGDPIAHVQESFGLPPFRKPFVEHFYGAR